MSMAQTLPASKPTLLRNTMLADALFTAAGALFTLWNTDMVDQFLGLGQPFALRMVAIVSLLYAGELIWLARRPSLSRATIQTLIILDVLWVVASVALLSFGPAFTTAGYWTMLIVADAVALFGLLKFLGFRRMGRGA